MPGAAFDATSTRTQSWNDAASTMSEPNRSHAHLIADDAGLVSSSRATEASSPRSMSTSGRSVFVGSRMLMLTSCRRALPVADVGDVRTRLVVVDVELGADIGTGELVEFLQAVA